MKGLPLIYLWGHHPQLHLFCRQKTERQTQKTKVVINIAIFTKTVDKMYTLLLE